ncbi:MAG: peptidoglycan D,D-transpeptidase FtsI family protein, partial [Nitrospinota bacterium]
VKKIESLKLKGVHFAWEQRRFYPGRELAARTVGFVGIDNQGLAGLESHFDEIIRGTPEKRRVERDALGQVIDTSVSGAKLKGNDVILTLDKVIQFIAEKELNNKIKETRAKGGVVIVMNPENGEILAMADNPQFNPNEYNKYHRSFWNNRAVSSVFEPGSTFKMFVAASALDSSVIHPEEVVFCENGKYRVGDINVHEAHYKKYGKLSLREVLAKSSNIGAIKIGERMSPDTFYAYLKKFGVGAKTGINLPGESRGLFKSPEKWSGSTRAAVSFGQEVSVTPIQLVTAVSSIANGGLLLKPLIVKEIVKNGEKVKSFEKTVVRRVISKGSGKIMGDLLQNVVENGTGKRAQIPGYRVAGKTGTAQKALQHGRGYSKTKFISSFAGFVSSDDVPILSMVVIIDEPQTEKYGGRVAAPVFKSIASQTLRYLKVPSESNRVYREAGISVSDSLRRVKEK